MSCLEDCEESIRDMTIMFLEETIEHLSEELKERSQRQNIMQMKHNKEIEKMSKRHSREINLITQNHQKVFEKLKQDVKEAEKKSRTKDYSQIGSLMNLVTTQKAYIEKLECELDESNGLLAGMRKSFAETEAEFTSTLLQLQEKLGNADDLVTERRIENEKLIEDVENATKSLELIILSQAEQIKILSESKVQQNDEVCKRASVIFCFQQPCILFSPLNSRLRKPQHQLK